MAQARRKKDDKQKSGLTIHISRGLREAALFILLAISLFLLTALITHNIQDPGWSYTGPSTSISNMAGIVGAWFSDVLYMLFGYLSYLFPIMIAYSGWLVLRERTDEGDINFHVLGIRWLGFFMTLATGCALTSLHFVIPVDTLPLDGGGILGRWIGDAMASALGVLGSTLILLAVFLAGITVFTGLSWLSLMDAIGDKLLSTYEWLQLKIAEYRELREEKKEGEIARETREKVVKAETKKKEARKNPVRIEPVINKVEVSERHSRESQISLFDDASGGDTELPPLRLLDEAIRSGKGLSTESLEALSRLVEIKLKDFNIEVEVVAVHPGPVITRFEMQPAPGVKASKITALSKDLARSLSVQSVRVVEVIPGKTYVGLEIPNEHKEIVSLSEILMSKAYDKTSSPLTVALGKDISGQPMVADLGKMPHLLVAGTTGSGKSVGINTMLISLLYKSTPEDVRLILIDPKMLELNVYDDIPHLLTPVVTDMSEAANALRWAVGEMENRYKLMAALGVRNITGYNRKVSDAIEAGEPIKDPLFTKDEFLGGDDKVQDLKALPFIVVVVDEFADLIMVVGKPIEQLIARLAQKARASGIHLILATQRPSVDVITGLIKSNIPSRIAFQVSSKVDSRTILDQMGAEQLLGHGDMLFMNAGSSIPERVHGAFVDDHEVHAVCEHVRQQAKPNYIENLIADNSDIIKLPGEGPSQAESDAESDVLYDEAVQIVTESGKASISYVQRRLKIGYNRAARMVEQMEASGVVTAMQSNGQRQVLAPPPPEL
ncbi:MAG: DNA translocase FtsK 4TM domain-containing protein [Gammaproteobacteria bacterium]|nr:DNA translocase FtsK 4TM domain-containing protein [Gammaproteobacteria bacterium]